MKLLIEAERRSAVFLVWRDGEHVLQVRELDDDARTRSIGRRDGVDIQLEGDPLVSGLHAELICVASEWAVLDDRMSKNGTFVNERRSLGRQRLHDGDRIRIGGTIVVFNVKSALEIVPTVPDDRLLAVAQLTRDQRTVLDALCRPLLADPPEPLPATNKQIADEIHLSVGAVKMRLGALYTTFGLQHLAQNVKRLRLAQRAIESGLVNGRDVARDP